MKRIVTIKKQYTGMTSEDVRTREIFIDTTKIIAMDTKYGITNIYLEGGAVIKDVTCLTDEEYNKLKEGM